MSQKFIYIILGLFLAGLPLWAQDSTTAKITYIEGVARVNANPARVDDPIFEGDKMSTEKGRVEVGIDGSFVRLNHHTQVTFVSLQKESVSLEVNFGEVYIQAEDEISIQTPHEAFSVGGIYRVEVDRYGTQKYRNPALVDDFDRWEMKREMELTRSYEPYYHRERYYGWYPYGYFWPSVTWISWQIGWYPDYYWYPDSYWYHGFYWGFYPYWGWRGFYVGRFPGLWLRFHYPGWYYFPFFHYSYGYYPYYYGRHYYADWSYYYRLRPGLTTIHKAQLLKPASFSLSERRSLALSSISVGRLGLNWSIQPSQPNPRRLSPSSLTRRISSPKVYPSHITTARLNGISRNSPVPGKTSPNHLKQTITRPSRLSSFRSANSISGAISRPSSLPRSTPLSPSSRLSTSPRLSPSPRLSVFPRQYTPSRLSSPSRITTPMRSFSTPSFSRSFNTSFSRPSFGSFPSSFSRPSTASRPGTGSIRRR